jgi:hypothetical protein
VGFLDVIPKGFIPEEPAFLVAPKCTALTVKAARNDGRRGLYWTTIRAMYHYDPATALEELSEEAILPNPVRVRDMILRKRLTPDRSLELNRLFLEYQKFFGEAQKLGKEILKHLAD